MAPSSIADTSFSAPTYSVIGVRAPPRIKTSVIGFLKADLKVDFYVCMSLSFNKRRRILPEGVRGMASVRCHFRIIL